MLCRSREEQYVTEPVEKELLPGHGLLLFIRLRRRHPTFLGLAMTCAALFTSTVAASAVTVDLVSVGNAGNGADLSTGFGAVAYDYRIGMTEVTNAQYVDFLNAVAATDPFGLYSTSMGSYTYGGIMRAARRAAMSIR